MNSSQVYGTLVEESMNIFPTSLQQQRIWFFQQLEASNAAHTIFSHIRLHIPLNLEIFKQSLDNIVQRHAILRTAIEVIDAQPVQVIIPSLSIPLSVIDIQSLSETEQVNEIERLAEEEAQRPFNVSQPPLMRTTLLKLGQEDYLLFLSIHSIISDAWSIKLIYQELALLYEAFSNGRTSPLAPLTIQYSDYTLRQQESLQDASLAEQLSFWKRQLENAPAVLTLPTDHPRPAGRTYQGAVQPFELSKFLTDSLKTLSYQEGVSLYVTLMTAFQILLHRYSGQDDFLIGLPLTGRTSKEMSDLIGSCSNTLVVRNDLSSNPTFRELLKRVRKGVLDAHAHQDIPFEYMINELQIERTVAQNPLFQVTFDLNSSSPVLPPQWDLTPLKLETLSLEFDLSLILDEEPEGLIGRFEYNTDLFDVATIHRLVGHWQTLLESIVADAGQHIGELPLLTEAERHQLLAEWNVTDIEYPEDKCIHQLFEEQVERTPDAVAVVFEEKCLTYRGLNNKANQLAHYLQQLGVGPEVLVGIYVERSLEMVVGLLGILKAGGAYVPLDSTYPSERLAFMLADTQAPVVLTRQQLLTKLDGYEGHIVCLDSDWEQISQESVENLVGVAVANSLSYVIYTSGSTGKPKSVLVRHASVVHLFKVIHDYFHFDKRDVWSLFHSYAFDFSVWELWGGLVSGGRVIVVPYEVSRSPEAFYNLLHTEQVTILSQCPLAFHQLIQIEEATPNAQKLALRHVIFGCEAFDFQILKLWFDRQGKHAPQLAVMYGPTETTVFVTYYSLSATDLASPRGSIIGKPIPGLQIYLLDRYKQLVPVGVPGEVYIGGAGLAEGYLHRPELTAERFVSNPFSQKLNACLYKSGDLARYLPDGNIEFLGRIDQQVKIRGFRIELGEIEEALGQHPQIREAVVVAREDTPGDKRLVAYIVAVQGKVPVSSNLRSFLKEKLPEYMLPSTFMLLDALPLTPNCKVDRRALPAPAVSKRSEEESYVAPISLAHYQLVQIWESLLETQPIGIRDNFFDLGGYSLLATRMVNEFESMSGKKIPLSTLFAGPTIEQFADALERQEEEITSYPLVAVQALGKKRPFFFLHGDWTGGAFYCFTLAHALGTEQPFYALEPYRVDGEHIPTTFEDMASAHLESLRTLQPEGPYLLGGFCNGGLLAYEMARQLRTEGQQVDLLFLINPAPPSYLRLLRTIINCSGNLLRLSQDKRANYFLSLRHALRHLYRQIHSSGDARLQDFEQLIQVDARLNVMFPPVEALRRDYVGIFTWLATGYVLHHYPGKITFLWASKEPSHLEEWRDVVEATEVETQVIPGTLMSCITEHVQTLIGHLRESLNKVQSAL